MDIAYHRGDSPQNEMRKMTENEIKEIALEEGEVLKIKVNGEIISILNRERIGLEVMMKDTIDLIWCDTDKDGNELTGHQSLNKFEEHLDASNKGGNITRIARVKLESETRESIVSDENYLDVPQKLKKKKKKLLKNVPVY